MQDITCQISTLTSDFTSPAHSSDQDSDPKRPIYSANVILDDPNDKSTYAKLTTNAGISVSYVAPALPPELLDLSHESDTGWDTIEEEESDPEQVDESYKSFLRPYGQVLLDPDLDFEPQIMVQDNADQEAIDDYPSSWEDDQNDDIVERLANTNDKHQGSKEDPWSDIGQSVNSSFEFWKIKNKLKAVQKPKLYETKYQHNNKYASDSNINDAVDMTEPGLRKIPKEAIYSTTDQSAGSPQALEESAESEHVYYSINDDLHNHDQDLDHDIIDKKTGANIDVIENHDNIYESVELEHNPESGFFSFDVQPGISTGIPGQGLDISRKITCIPVNQRPSSSSDDYASCHVTVNGKLWINPSNKDTTNDIVNDKVNPETNTYPVLTKKQWNKHTYFFFPLFIFPFNFFPFYFHLLFLFY